MHDERGEKMIRQAAFIILLVIVGDTLFMLGSAEIERRHDRWKRKWILCSEKMPEDFESVLVTDHNGYIRHCYWNEKRSRFETVEEGMGVNAVAWIQEPEPWREEKEDNENGYCKD